MLGRSHLVSGVMAGLAICAVAPVPGGLVPVVVGVAAYSALVPDVDHPAAPVARVLGPVSWGLCWTVRNLSAHLTGTAHRGLSHSVVFALAWGVFVGGLFGVWTPAPVAVWIGAGAALGCFTHILGDVLTVTGCKYVLWPSPVQVRIPRAVRFRTGGPAERVVVFAFMVVAVVLLPAAVR